MTLVLTGVLPAIIIISALLAGGISLLLLTLYRRATLRSMRATAGLNNDAPEAPTADQAATGIDRPPLQIVRLDRHLAAELGRHEPAAFYKATMQLRHDRLVHVAGGLAYAIILAVPWLVAADGGFAIGRFGWLIATYLWPTALIMMLVFAPSPREATGILAAYVTLAAVLGAVTLWRNPGAGVVDLVVFWLIVNLPVTVLLLVYLNRRVRAVGPLVLAVTTAGVAGALLLIEAARRDDRLVALFASLGKTLGLGAGSTVTLMLVIGCLVLGAVGWWLLVGIGHLYRRKAISDQSITLYAAWMLFAIVQSVTLVFEGWWWIATGPVALAAYALVVRGANALRRPPAASDPPSLLLLRVFALGKRSEALFDTLSAWWRRIGNLSLICGPDLVQTGIEPHELLDFLGGRLSRQFVGDAGDLDRRMAGLDLRPDPDGRYRVNELFCHADNWQQTVQRLAVHSSMVLMDLRSFSPDCPGCLFEIGHLLDNVPLTRTLLLVDDSTDIAFLTGQLQLIWQRLDASSPNLAATDPGIRLFHLAARDRQTFRALLHLLFAADSRGPTPTTRPESVAALFVE